MATSIGAHNTPVTADEHEREQLNAIERLMQGEQAPKLVGTSGEQVELPAPALALLRELVHQLAREQAVAVVATGKELTTQQAADILNVSRPFLVKLLEQGKIPFALVGAHRRILVSDLLAYKQRRDAARREALDELARISQEMGMYDMPSTEQ